MARYRIYIAEEAQKELKKLGPAAAKEIVLHIAKKLGDEPQAFGKPLTGDLAGHYRLRVSGYRIVYTIIESHVWVVVLAAGKREEGNIDNIYNWLSGDTLAKRLFQLLRQIEEDEEDAGK